MSAPVPIDPAAAALIEILEANFPRVNTASSAQEARQLAKQMPRAVDVEPVAAVEDRTIPGPDGEVPVRIYWPSADRAPRPGVVYFHGGGFVICDLDTHDGACRRLLSLIHI